MTTGSDIARPSTSGSAWEPQRQRLTTYRDSCHGRTVVHYQYPYIPDLKRMFLHLAQIQQANLSQSCTKPSFIDSTVEPHVANYRERKENGIKPRKEEGYGKPPIIDAVPLTQNKISARNVLYTLPSTGSTGEREKDANGKKRVGCFPPPFHPRIPPTLLIATFLSPPSSSPSRACLTLTRKLH
ncbi:hypothetical protein EAG_09924 [Camponotus floridanus]|uniref:Uncharacterized protein n=1 Tax=Camponotus floridanus TaxID=104421 RepID=E2A6E9_CAMFO|nr:hypothetical protein EAG_09924 [Camponotus floridanus]